MEKGEGMNVDQILNLTDETVWKEVERICKNQGVEPERFLCFKEIGGLHWVLREMSSAFYISLKPIDEDIRERLRLLMVAESVSSSENIFYINKRIQEEKYSWYKDKWIQKKEELITNIKAQLLKEELRNSYF